MGFLDNYNDTESAGNTDKLDLVDFERNLINKFNDEGILNTKYLAEELGIFYGKGKSDVYRYDGSEEIVICPEPLEFLKEFDDVSDNTSKANALFQEKITTFQRIKLDRTPRLKGSSVYGERMWMNKTLTGINLRPGNLNDDRNAFNPIRMCDDNVHGLIAGRTGSGKSVFINALILSLITEYSPWELNLYLADFKKVELSRYMNNADEANGDIAFTPHVNACAATSEIRYVTSLIKYLVDCMNARQEFFSRLGVTKIQEFRNKYNLVLPRVLLIVDEFQQLFTEATNREKEEIQTMLNSITKLGRATGFHLIFASQEMSGTLRGNTLANFKIRMALPCNQQISVDILGNGQAVNLERGYVLVNTESGDELQNQKYRVPFIETDKKDEDEDEEKTAFYKFLDEIKLASCLYDISYKTATQKFYREELQETEKSYRDDLDWIKDRKNELVSKNQALFDAVILGKTVLYSPKRNDKVSFYIEKGRNKGVMIACPEADNAARVRKLLTENLLRSDQQTYHFGLELNNYVLERYRIDDAIQKSSIHKYYRCDTDGAIEFFQLIYYLRLLSKKYVDNNAAILDSIRQDEQELYTLLEDNSKVEAYNEYRKQYREASEKLMCINERIAGLSKEKNQKLMPPIISFLKKCSSEIVLIPADNTKVDLLGLSSYKDVANAFTMNDDSKAALQKGLSILDSKIDALSKIESKNDEEQNQKVLAVLRNKIFRRVLLFFADRFEDKIPETTKLSGTLDKIYLSIEPEIRAYKQACEADKTVSEELEKLSEDRETLLSTIAKFDANPNEMKIAEEKMTAKINAFVVYIFDTAYTMLGYKKNKPEKPTVRYSVEGGYINWVLNESALDEKIQLIINDIIQRFCDQYRNKANYFDFKKVVIWINGLDEIEKIPNSFVEMIRNAINQNILIIGIITSELRDTTIRKAFDYAFVTGNIEKFYSMFDIKYTKQPLDSIVVNFGIRSKGFDIPFKMYKSNLEEIQAPNFIDQLLNDD